MGLNMKARQNKNPYMSDAEKLSQFQRYILVHCCLYYEMDQSVIDDFEYQNLCNQYLELLASIKQPLAKQRSLYWYVFKGFDGSTGYHLLGNLKPDHCEHILLIARNVLASYMKVRDLS